MFVCVYLYSIIQTTKLSFVLAFRASAKNVECTPSRKWQPLYIMDKWFFLYANSSFYNCGMQRRIIVVGQCFVVPFAFNIIAQNDINKGYVKF